MSCAINGKQEKEMPIGCSPLQWRGTALGVYDIIMMLNFCGGQYNDIIEDRQYNTYISNHGVVRRD